MAGYESSVNPYHMGPQTILRTVVFPYLVSRGLVMCILLAVPLVSLGTGGDGVHSVSIRPRGALYHEIENSLSPGDAVHYMDIAQHAYSRPVSRAWFPFFPIVWRCTSLITHEFAVTGQSCRIFYFFLGSYCFTRLLPYMAIQNPLRLARSST